MWPISLHRSQQHPPFSIWVRFLGATRLSSLTTNGPAARTSSLPGLVGVPLHKRRRIGEDRHRRSALTTADSDVPLPAWARADFTAPVAGREPRGCPARSANRPDRARRLRSCAIPGSAVSRSTTGARDCGDECVHAEISGLSHRPHLCGQLVAHPHSNLRHECMIAGVRVDLVRSGAEGDVDFGQFDDPIRIW